MMRVCLILAACALAVTASAQSFLKNQPPRVALDVRVDGTLASPPRTAQVRLVATPIPGVHVYAPGNPDYIPVNVAITPVAGLTIGEPIFPEGEHYFFAPLKQAVKVYSKPFRMRIPVKAAADFVKRRGTGAPVVLKGVVSYQACDDKVCFPPQTLPFTVDVPVRATKPGSSEGPPAADGRQLPTHQQAAPSR